MIGGKCRNNSGSHDPTLSKAHYKNLVLNTENLESGLTMSAGDPQVPGKKYLPVMHPRLRIRIFPRMKTDPGNDFNFLQVFAGTYGLPTT